MSDTENLEHKGEELRLTKLDHAIQLLNNHLPVVAPLAVREPDEWKVDSDNLSLDRISQEIREPFVRALVAAAEHIAKAFETTP